MKDGPVLLVAEDDPDDQVLVSDALGELPERVVLHFVEDGIELLTYLAQSGEMYPPPDLILLDLNMPGMDGRTALQAIKNDPSSAQIPVVILTTSSAPEDAHYCQTFGVQGYYRKPSSLMALVQILDQVIKNFT